MSTIFFFFPKKSSSRASRFSNNPSSSEGIKAPLHPPALRHRKKQQRLIGQACCQALFQSDLIASPARNVVRKLPLTDLLHVGTGQSWTKEAKKEKAHFM
ncbi:hypothetical protein AVEN_11664-1 [Araneus ventricosus]|uniref:Uncharacterized protein n=1 Tax=Araneus ventricosus TaxID=182803 RepID=A0A4Y2MBR7_ARAVE|nr:hypothetical protein AVEN_11664-1 [Araneus ventricosus]